MGDPVAAREAADRAVALMRDGGYQYGLGWTRRVIGHIARAAGDLETALAESADALAIFTSIHARFEAARTQLELAELAQARGDVAGATTWLTEAAQALASMTVSRYDERIAALRAALPSAYPPEA
jgi:tetratricopeptide (TPR) repeat protein